MQLISMISCLMYKINNMKTIFFSVLMLLGTSSLTFAQDANEVAKSQTKTEIQAGKTSGQFVFTMPESLSKEDVLENAKYYTHYFTVEFDASSHEAKLKMVQNDEKGRMVIVRFLNANGIQFMNVEGTVMSVSDFFDKILK